MSEKIKCIAIDDEPLALDVIRRFCERIGGFELLTFSDPVEGLDAIRQHHPALVFLDIEMEGINGLTIATQLPDDTCFIFTTAYLNYALEGFNLDAVDYLHKPFAFSRFQTAISKAMRRIGVSQPVAAPQALVVKQDYNNVSIPLNEILYVEAMEGYSKIFRENGTCTISRVILKNIGGMLPTDTFLRIHRSFIVAVPKIKSFSKQEVKLIDGTSLPIGRQYSAAIYAALKGNAR